MNIQSTINRENYIFINGCYDNFEQMINLVHELGHIKDQEELLSTEQRANQLYRTVIGQKFHTIIKDEQIIF